VGTVHRWDGWMRNKDEGGCDRFVEMLKDCEGRRWKTRFFVAVKRFSSSGLGYPRLGGFVSERPFRMSRANLPVLSCWDLLMDVHGDLRLGASTMKIPEWPFSLTSPFCRLKDAFSKETGG
jgi:hypothetical protein